MKKILSLAAFALFATASMAQSLKADAKIQEGKFAEALTIVEAEIQKTKADMQAAVEKAKAKGKEADLGKFNAKLAGLYNQAGICESQAFNPELMNAANNAPLDTAKFVSSLDRMVNNLTESYVYDNTPNLKGKVAPKFNDKNVALIENCLDYYFYAGIFLNQNGDKEGASANFKKHLALPNNPALASKKATILEQKADNYAQTAYYGTLLNYEMKKWDEILATVDAGLGNKEYNHDLYLIKAEAVMETTKDTLKYMEVLRDAVMKVDNNVEFAKTLIALYSDHNDTKNALELADELIKKNAEDLNAWYIKGSVYLNVVEDYKASRECFEKVLAIDPQHVDANFNMAASYMNEVADRVKAGEFKFLDKKTVSGQKNVEAYKKELETFQGYYRNAQGYMEKVRELTPTNSKKWASPLQRIYFNLGMQEEADAMDDIMRSNH